MDRSLNVKVFLKVLSAALRGTLVIASFLFAQSNVPDNTTPGNYLKAETILWDSADPGGQWIRQYPLIPNRPTDDILFVDSRNGWLINYDKVYKTVDGGDTWTMRSYDGWWPLKDLHFITANIGWAVGGTVIVGKGPLGVVIKTTDGGETWIVQTNAIPGYLNAVFFIDEQTGWITGTGLAGNYNVSILYKTLDGGKTWVPQVLPTSMALYSLFFLDANVGWACGSSGIILKTTNGGANWEQKPSDTVGEVNDIRFIDTKNGWAVVGGVIYRSVDGGDTWAQQSLGVPSFFGTANSIFFLNTKTGWITTSDGLLKTVDSGISWQMSKVGNSLVTCHFVDAGLGWLIDMYGTVYKSTDGGATWKNTTSLTNSALWSVFFIDDRIGWISGAGGEIMKTTNAGQTWQSLKTNSTVSINNLCFVDARYGWACQNRGTILRTTDGGDYWQSIATPTSRDLYGIFFINHRTGYAVGGGTAVEGIGLKTTDGGTTWVSLGKLCNQPLIDLFFVAADTGWAVGMDGIILKTINGGTTWAPQTSGSTSWLNDVFFLDSMHGFVGGDGTLLTTKNGGQNWSAVVGISGIVEEIFFTDEKNGWAVGTGPGVAKGIGGSSGGIHLLSTGSTRTWTTTEGGSTWIEQTWINGAWMMGACMIDLNHGWSVGKNGYVFRYANTLAIPPAPTQIKATVLADDKIQIAWNDSSDTETGIFLSRRTGTDGEYRMHKTLMANTVTFIDSGLSTNTTYFYRLQAFNSIGRSALTSPVYAKTWSTFIAHDQTDCPTEFHLAQNYPNPFNPITTLSFNLPEQSFVHLAVYDVLGKQQATLVETNMEAGEHRVQWHAGDLSSGVYLVRLKTRDQLRQIKIMLLK